jgi:hypothetical protein
MLAIKKDVNDQRWSISRLSQFFYKKSSVLVAVILTAISFGYLFLVMMGQAAGFELADSNIKSLGTSFGFDQADVLVFLTERSEAMINAYIDFNQIWDPVYGLTYGLMYVAWVSLLFKPFSQQAGILNLFPMAQVVFDWLEDYQLVVLANQYLAEGMVSALNAQLASVFSLTKWACSGLTFVVLLTGIVLLSARAIRHRMK